MNSHDLSCEQAAAMGNIIGHHFRYVRKPRSPSEQPGLPAADPVYFDVCRAFDRTQAEWLNLQYLSCTSGVGILKRSE